MNRIIGLVTGLALTLASCQPALDEKQMKDTSENAIKTRIGTLDFTHDFENGYPTDETVKLLFDEMDFQILVLHYLN